jgi:hypothetical protein
MKHMAVLISNKVVNVITASDYEFDTADRIAYTPENRAIIGGDYVDGYFYRPQPYPSWTRNEGQWVAPVPMPDDGENYGWDEDAQEWHPVTV